MSRKTHSLYSPSYPKTLIYMLQRTEYEVKAYLKWFRKVENFNKVSTRGSLVKTNKAKSLLSLVYSITSIFIVGSVVLILLGIKDWQLGYVWIGIFLLIFYPILIAYLITIPLTTARYLIVKPKESQLIRKSRQIFLKTKAIKIAVAGSYGKTTMKELLATVLAESGIVAFTPDNKNVASSHAKFAHKLTGNEKYVIIELGEGRPGDVARFARTIKPDIAVITGIAPAHLDKYPTVATAARDIFSLTKLTKKDHTYINGESRYLEPYKKDYGMFYTREGIGGWKVKKVNISFEGLSFNLVKGRELIRVRSKLLGRHQIGPLSIACVLAYDLGCKIPAIENGVSKTRAFEHRMEPRIISNAQVIDDTYNGNLEGIKAGLELLDELKAKRKIYVTPGLVDQGIETKSVHIKIGGLIKATNPNMVVLMRNSVTNYILTGLDGFKGDLRIEDNPLKFYSNIDKFLASGDLLMMQNDWPDNYL